MLSVGFLICRQFGDSTKAVKGYLLIFVVGDDDPSNVLQALDVLVVVATVKRVGFSDGKIGEGVIDASHQVELPLPSQVVQDGDLFDGGWRVIHLELDDVQVACILVVLRLEEEVELLVFQDVVEDYFARADLQHLNLD